MEYHILEVSEPMERHRFFPKVEDLQIRKPVKRTEPRAREYHTKETNPSVLVNRVYADSHHTTKDK